jgi:hypothetical protein
MVSAIQARIPNIKITSVTGMVISFPATTHLSRKTPLVSGSFARLSENCFEVPL